MKKLSFNQIIKFICTLAILVFSFAFITHFTRNMIKYESNTYNIISSWFLATICYIIVFIKCFRHSLCIYVGMYESSR